MVFWLFLNDQINLGFPIPLFNAAIGGFFHLSGPLGLKRLLMTNAVAIALLILVNRIQILGKIFSLKGTGCP